MNRPVTPRDIDIHAADLLTPDDETLRSLVTTLSALTTQGDVCLPLGECVPPEELPELIRRLKGWRHVGVPGEYRPLILEGDRLYLHRFHAYEERVAADLRRRGKLRHPVDLRRGRKILDRLFGPPGGEMDHQRRAAATSLFSSLLVISGGPGTGKTTTVVKILHLLRELDPTLRIRLAAPTGKAAARLAESVRLGSGHLPSPEGAVDIPTDATTIHRLLGISPDGSRLRHDRKNPLPCDLLVIDEASMISLSLMARLLDSLPPNCRLILIGDRDQLASVDPGSLLGDICRSPAPGRVTPETAGILQELTGHTLETTTVRAPLIDSLVILTRTYRFGEESGIGRVSRAVIEGDPDTALEILRSDRFPDCTLTEITPVTPLSPLLEPAVIEGYGRMLEGESPAEILEAFGRFRILSPLREGNFGVRRINMVVEEILSRRGVIQPFGEWYHGRGILVTENDHARSLSNGDIGIALRQEGTLTLHIAAYGGVRSIPLTLPPPHETAFAMTIHKSQGSEFDRIVVVIPPGDTPILFAELLYTAITRGRKRVDLLCSEETLRIACRRRVERRSLLGDKLWREE